MSIRVGYLVLREKDDPLLLSNGSTKPVLFRSLDHAQDYMRAVATDAGRAIVYRVELTAVGDAVCEVRVRVAAEEGA